MKIHVWGEINDEQQFRLIVKSLLNDQGIDLLNGGYKCERFPLSGRVELLDYYSDGILAVRVHQRPGSIVIQLVPS